MSGKQQVNTLRLIRLLNEYGTTALRNEFDAKFPPASLATSLSSLPLKNALQALLRKKILNTSQWNELYPSSGVPDSKKFDISLLYLLLRNFCGLKPKGDPLWTSNPPAADRSVEANIARVRWYRNDVIHDKAAGVDDATFQNYWAVITLALMDLGIPQAELDALKDSPLDEEMYENLLLQWKREEEGVKELVLESGKEHREDQKKLMEALDELKQKGEQTKSRVEQVQEDILKDGKQLEEKLERTAAEASSARKEVKAMKEVIIEGRQASEGDILKKLAKINFQQEQEFQAKKCQPGTREWLFEKVENWFRDEDSESRVMIILANAGMGKTVAAATVCQRMQTSGNLGGVHFCKHRITRYRNAKLMLQSLTSSLCDVLPEYRAELVKHLSHNLGEENDLNKMDVEELFFFLLQEPLGQVCRPKEPLMFVIDALDEAEYHGRNELMEVIASYFTRLPTWLKFLVTSRPDVNAKSMLADLHPVEISPDLEKNLEDIELFLREKLPPLVPIDKLDTALSLCIEKSQGLMLYACCTIEFLSKRKDILWEHLESILPDSISSWYKDYVNRLQKDLGVTDAVFSRFLAALVSSREALPLEIIPLLLKLPVDSADGDSEELVLRAIEAVSLLLPLHDGKIDVFHKSFTDWLTKPQMHPFRSKPKSLVTEKQGHQVLAEVCGQILESLKNKEDLPEEFSASESYALKHSTRHVLESGSQSTKSKGAPFDLEVLVLKLVEGSVYEIIEEYDGYEDTVFPNVKDIRRILNLNSLFLSVRPLNILDHIVNEAGCEELRSEARGLLAKEKFQHIWMEVTGKKFEDQPHVLSEMEVGKKVLEIDVSRDGKMVAVNAVDWNSGLFPREISLWYLSSGKCLWRVGIDLLDKSWTGPCTFSPDGSIILFGRLDQACNLDGKVQSYFDCNSCEYSKCRFSPDGQRLLTQHFQKVELKLWDVNLQQCLVDMKLQQDIGCSVNDFQFSHCGQYIAAAGVYGICLWDSLGQVQDSIKFDLSHLILGPGHLDWVHCPSGDMLFWSCGNFRSIYKISSSRLAKVAQRETATVELVFSKDSKHVAAVVGSSTLSRNVKEELQHCRVADMELRCILRRNHYTLVDGRSAIAILPGETLEVVATCPMEDVKIDDRIIPFCSSLEVSGNKMLALVKSFPNSAVIYEIIEAGNLMRGMVELNTEIFPLTNDSILVYYYRGICQVCDKNDPSKLLWAWECDPGNKVLCAADDIVVFMTHKTGCVSLHDVQTGNLKWTLGEEAGSRGWIDPDNSRLLTATSKAVKLWDLSSETCLKCHELGICDCSIASSKQLVAVLLTNGFAVIVLNEMSGEIMKRINACATMFISFVHGTHLACLASAAVHLVDVETSEKVAMVRLVRAVSFIDAKLCYNPISRGLAVAHGDEFTLLKVNCLSL